MKRPGLRADARWIGSKKSRLGTIMEPVPQTDTGGLGEKPQALERTVVKELGKLTPYVRKKGALAVISYRQGAENRLWELFIKNTALC